jgi:Domain of unknown function (DUF4287)/Domain of unknown function (DUF5655)
MAETYKEPDKIKQYMASLEANLESATGKTLAQWVKIAKTCPYEKPGERLKWFKREHGLGMSRAGLVLWRAFGGGTLGENDPNRLIDNLFSKSFAEQRALYEKVAGYVERLGSGTISPRKGYVALYRLKQYGAIKPRKAGLFVGLALQKYPKSDRLVDVKNFGGGDRNKKALVLTSAKDFDVEAKALIKAAWAEA